jgi:hypothetical protein
MNVLDKPKISDIAPDRALGVEQEWRSQLPRKLEEHSSLRRQIGGPASAPSSTGIRMRMLIASLYSVRVT